LPEQTSKTTWDDAATRTRPARCRGSPASRVRGWGRRHRLAPSVPLVRRTTAIVKGFRRPAKRRREGCTEAGVRKASREETAGSDLAGTSGAGIASSCPFPPLPLGLWNGEVAWRAAVVDCRGLGCASPESGRLTAEFTPLLMSISRVVLPRSVPRPSSYCRCPVEIGCSSSTALSCYQMANFASRTGAIDGPLSEPSHRRNRF
jgi:hypothetical protein